MDKIRVVGAKLHNLKDFIICKVFFARFCHKKINFSL